TRGGACPDSYGRLCEWRRLAQRGAGSRRGRRYCRRLDPLRAIRTVTLGDRPAIAGSTTRREFGVIYNEIAQWAVLAFLTIFVVGLTRQLGFLLNAPPEKRAGEF